jgi:hypothetical protein
MQTSSNNCFPAAANFFLLPHAHHTKSTIGIMADPQCDVADKLTFLSIPRELRNEIYDILIPIGKISLRVSGGSFLTTAWSLKHATPLSQTCKQLRSECLVLFRQRTTKVELERTPIRRTLQKLPDLFLPHIMTLQLDHIPSNFVPRQILPNLETLVITCRHDCDINTFPKWARDDSSPVEHFRMEYRVQMLSVGSGVNLVVRHRLAMEHQREEPEGAGPATTWTAVMVNMHTLISPGRC